MHRGPQGTRVQKIQVQKPVSPELAHNLRNTGSRLTFRLMRQNFFFPLKQFPLLTLDPLQIGVRPMEGGILSQHCWIRPAAHTISDLIVWPGLVNHYNVVAAYKFVPPSSATKRPTHSTKIFFVP